MSDASPDLAEVRERIHRLASQVDNVRVPGVYRVPAAELEQVALGLADEVERRGAIAAELQAAASMAADAIEEHFGSSSASPADDAEALAESMLLTARDRINELLRPPGGPQP